MIRFSCAEYAFPLLTRAQRFALLRLLGFSHVDIGLFERSSGLEPSQLLADSSGFTRSLRDELNQAGLQASDVFLQIGADPAESAANDPRAEVRRRSREIFLHTIDLCNELGCAHLTGLPGVWHDGSDRTSGLELAFEEAIWRNNAASRAGIRYAIEPHMGSICFSVESTQELIAAVPGLTLTLDYGHFVAAGIGSAAVHALLPFATHVHVRGGARNRLQTAVEENEIDFEGMIRGLSRNRYSGFLAIEYVWIDWKSCNRTDNISETLLLRRLLAQQMLEQVDPPIPK